MGSNPTLAAASADTAERPSLRPPNGATRIGSSGVLLGDPAPQERFELKPAPPVRALAISAVRRGRSAPCLIVLATAHDLVPGRRDRRHRPADLRVSSLAVVGTRC